MVVCRVNGPEARTEALEPIRGECYRLRVAINSDDGEILETLQRSLRVPAHAQGRVDEDGTRSSNSRGKHVQAFGE